MKHFDFAESDLQANRRGVLSERQRKKFRGGDPTNLALGAIFMVVASLPLLCSGIKIQSTLDFILISAWLLGWGGPGIFLLLRGLLGKIRVERAQGFLQIVQKSAFDSKNKTRYWSELYVGSQNFSKFSSVEAGVDSSLADCLQEGATYIIYYVKSRAFMSQSAEVLSMELAR